MAAITAAVIAGVAVVGSTVVASKSAKDAAEAQKLQSEKALSVQQDEFSRIEEQLTPFIRGETPEQAQQRALVGLDGPEAQQAAQLALETPTTRALRTQGFRSLDQRASAVGQLGGSNRLKALAEFSGNLDRQLSGNQFNQLGALSGQRLGAAQALGGVGSASVSGQAQTLQGIGRTQAAGIRGQGQAFQSGLEGLGAIGLNLANQPQQSTSGLGTFNNQTGFGIGSGNQQTFIA